MPIFFKQNSYTQEFFADTDWNRTGRIYGIYRGYLFAKEQL